MQHSEEMGNDDGSQHLARVPLQSVIIVALSGITGWYLVYRCVIWALGLF